MKYDVRFSNSGYFSKSEIIASKGENDRIVIVTNETLGGRGLFDTLKVYNEHGIHIITLQTRLIFFNEHRKIFANNKGSYGKVLESVSNVEAEYLPFYMVLRDLQSYISLKREVGSIEARKILEALGDIPMAREFLAQKTQKWFNKIIEHSDFNRLISKNSMTYHAMLNASEIFDENDISIRRRSIDFDSSKQKEFIVRFNLENYINDHKLHFQFDVTNKISKRLAVIIGENGVGKSTCLKKIVECARRGNLKNNDGKQFGVSKILGVTSGNISDVYPNSNVVSGLWFKAISLTKKSNNRSDSFTRLVTRLISSGEEIKGRSRADLFLHAIKSVQNYDELAISFNGVADLFYLKDIVFERSSSNKLKEKILSSSKFILIRAIDNKLLPLSSGEKVFLNFALYSSLYIEQDSLILFDEPETHLHPRFISDLVDILNTILEATNSVGLIATHSPYFVREVFSNQVKIFRKLEITDDDKKADLYSGKTNQFRIQVLKPGLQTYGEDIGAISRYVFGEFDYSKSVQNMIDRISKDSLKDVEIIEKYGESFSTNILSTIVRGQN